MVSFLEKTVDELTIVCYCDRCAIVARWGYYTLNAQIIIKRGETSIWKKIESGL